MDIQCTLSITCSVVMIVSISSVAVFFTTFCVSVATYLKMSCHKYTTSNNYVKLRHRRSILVLRFTSNGVYLQCNPSGDLVPQHSPWHSQDGRGTVGLDCLALLHLLVQYAEERAHRRILDHHAHGPDCHAQQGHDVRVVQLCQHCHFLAKVPGGQQIEFSCFYIHVAILHVHVASFPLAGVVYSNPPPHEGNEAILYVEQRQCIKLKLWITS